MVMKGAKLIELCNRHGLKNLTPHTVKTFKYQHIADADIFLGTCNVNILKPNPRPRANFAVLPGTTDRRPIKPWQLCSEEEKVLFDGSYTRVI